MKKTAFFIALGMVLCYAGVAQVAQNVIRGTVRSSIDSSVLAGVSIVVKGLPGGTTTNMEGVYSISVPGNATLIFSSAGYSQQEVPADGRSRINIFLMQSEKTQLDEVVVTTALGIKKQQKTLGYSVQEVSG
ncbi:MAG TPA: carboxypeptidase-like regulatory domain-containing protein, partial [Puia sp.]